MKLAQLEAALDARQTGLEARVSELGVTFERGQGEVKALVLGTVKEQLEAVKKDIAEIVAASAGSTTASAHVSVPGHLPTPAPESLSAPSRSQMMGSTPEPKAKPSTPRDDKTVEVSSPVIPVPEPASAHVATVSHQDIVKEKEAATPKEKGKSNKDKDKSVNKDKEKDKDKDKDHNTDLSAISVSNVTRGSSLYDPDLSTGKSQIPTVNLAMILF
jgi:hypothetical protein